MQVIPAVDVLDGAAVRLEVECIEARLTDLGAAWSTSAKPSHYLEAEEAGSTQ